jgi:DNA helicase-2/ATP-dependent DNA helicase PcrA
MSNLSPQSKPFAPSSYQQALFDEIKHGTGNIVVKARAGSGKTTTILKAMEMIPRKDSWREPSVLFCAFNKSIAEELKSRAPQGVDVKTLHSLGYQAVRNAWGSGVAPSESKDRDVAEEQLAAYFREHGAATAVDLGEKPEHRFVRENLSATVKLVSMAKACMAKTAEEIESLADKFDCWPPLVATERVRDLVVACIVQSSRESSEISFDDMVFLAAAPRLGMRVRQYDWVFVDETQDLNTAQLMLVRKALKPGGRIVAVGDPEQAIYGFRGADSEAMPTLIRELNAKVLPLSVTYRCPRQVVILAKQWVPDLEAHDGAADGLAYHSTEKAFFDGVKGGDFVLSRKNAPLVSACLKVLKSGKRAFIQGRDVGKSLRSLVEKAKTNSVPDLMAWLDAYRVSESDRLRAAKKEKRIEEMLDQVEVIVTLSEGMPTVAALLDRLNSLFDEGSSLNGRIMFSSVHKAKGLEADKVYLLHRTFDPHRSQEEANLYYVALTRAKKELSLVDL